MKLLLVSKFMYSLFIRIYFKKIYTYTYKLNTTYKTNDIILIKFKTAY